MEEAKVENELKLCGVKRDNLGKQLEKVQSHSSDILVFTLQWRDLEDYLKSAEGKVEQRFKELALKEAELQDKSFALEERAKLVEAAEADLEIKSDAAELKLTQIRAEQSSKTSQLNEMVESLRKTQVELDMKREQLTQMETDLERHRVEVELLDKTQSRRRELDDEIERKTKHLTLVQDKTAESGKLLETLSSELIKTRGELELNGIQLGQMKIDLDRSQIRNIELEEEIERKRKDLTAVLDKIAECGKQRELVEEELDSKQKLLETRSSELVSKEKELQVLILDLDLREQTVISLNDDMKETCQQMESKAKELEDIQRLIEERSAEYDSTNKELRSVKDTFREKDRELKSLQSILTERNKQVEEREKKMQHLDSSSEKLIKQLKLKQEEVCEINKAIKECSGELEAKRKHRDRVQSSVTDLTAELKSKERDLNSVKKKIQDSLKDFKSKEEKQVRLKASLMEREQGLELKEKELDARKERIDKKDEQLKSTEQKLASCVKDYEQKANKLSSFIQQSNTDHDLVRDANVSDNKTLQLLLRGHLKKCPQLHLDVSRSLKASSDPAKLVLDTIQGLYYAHQRTAVTNLDPNSVRRSSIYLLECLMGMSLKPMPEVQREAIKFATDWKKTTLVNAENPVEVLGFLHFLAAFSLAYAFDADKVQTLFDVAFLRKYAPSLCKALGVSALAPVNNVLSLDDKPEQHPPEVSIINSSDSCSPDVRGNIVSSQLGNEDGLRDFEGSASFAPNEVSTKLPMLEDPGRFVLASVEEALMGAQQRGELGLAEPIVKTLVPLLEELSRVVSSTDTDLQSDATKVAYRWSWMMGTRPQMSQLEAWAFLQFIVAYRLVKQTKQDETLQFASHVSHFKEAPKLFRSLGLSHEIPNFVDQLLKKALYFPAIRFMFAFNVKNNFSPLKFLKEEITNLRRSAKEKRRFESESEDRDAAKMRDIIELIEDFKLDIDIPVDLIVKFMVPREIQNQNQCVVVSSSSVPVQAPEILRMQASYIASHGSKPSLPTSFGAAPNPEVLDVETYQAGGSTAFQGRSSHHAGFKRPRVDPRPAIRPCFNPPSGYGRF